MPAHESSEPHQSTRLLLSRRRTKFDSGLYPMPPLLGTTKSTPSVPTSTITTSKTLITKTRNIISSGYTHSPASATTTSATATSKPTQVMMNFTVTSPPMLICPNGRLPLIDKMGRSIECELPENPARSSTTDCGNSTEHLCAFLSLNTVRGICCQRLSYEKTRCPSSMKPLIDVDTREVSRIKNV